MLAFYPEFEAVPVLNYKAVIMLDMSQSMKAAGNLEKDAKKVRLPFRCFNREDICSQTAYVCVCLAKIAIAAVK